MTVPSYVVDVWFNLPLQAIIQCLSYPRSSSSWFDTLVLNYPMFITVIMCFLVQLIPKLSLNYLICIFIITLVSCLLISHLSYRKSILSFVAQYSVMEPLHCRVKCAGDVVWSATSLPGEVAKHHYICVFPVPLLGQVKCHLSWLRSAFCQILDVPIARFKFLK